MFLVIPDGKLIIFLLGLTLLCIKYVFHFTSKITASDCVIHVLANFQAFLAF